jgi:hypothetical protein
LSKLGKKRDCIWAAIATVVTVHLSQPTAEANDARDVRLGAPVYEAATNDGIRSVSLASDGSYLAFQTERSTQVVDLSSKTITATVAHLPLSGSNMIAAFAQPCSVALLRGDYEASILSIVRCTDGTEISSTPLLPKRTDGTDAPLVAAVCGIVVAQSGTGIIVYDAASARVRDDLLAVIPKHFEYVFSARGAGSCNFFFASGYPADVTTVRIVRVDVRSGRAREIVRLGGRPDAEAPLFSFSNGAASPSARILAVPTFRQDLGPAARHWQPARIELFDARTSSNLPELKNPSDEASVSAVTFLDDASVLIGSRGGGTYLYSVFSHRLQRLALDRAFSLLDYAPQSMKLAVASDTAVRVYKLNTDE